MDRRRRAAFFFLRPGTRKVRPSVVLLLSALGVALPLATLPDYWDWDLHRLREVIRRDQKLSAQYAGSIQAVAAERRAAEEASQAAHEVARVKGRVTGSIQRLFDGFVADIVQQPDGKIVVVGFHNVPGVGVARLNFDGSLDQEFVRHASRQTAGDLTGVPGQVALVPDGGVLVAGRFDFEGRPRALVRFRPDGTLDEPFLSVTAALPRDARSDRQPRVAIQPDSTIVFVEFGYGSRPPVLLRSDGAIDQGWDPAAGGVRWDRPSLGADQRVVPRPRGLPDDFLYLGVQPDGRTLAVRTQDVPPPSVQWDWDFGDDPPRRESHLVRVGSDGAVEELPIGAPACDGPSWRFEVRAVAFQRDGCVLMAGDLPFLRRIGVRDECEHFAIWRITPSGALDPQFRRTSRPELMVGQEATTVNKILVLDDGRIMIGGAFTSVQGQPRVHLARLLPDGSVE